MLEESTERFKLKIKIEPSKTAKSPQNTMKTLRRSQMQIITEEIEYLLLVRLDLLQMAQHILYIHLPKTQFVAAATCCQISNTCHTADLSMTTVFHLQHKTNSCTVASTIRRHSTRLMVTFSFWICRDDLCWIRYTWKCTYSKSHSLLDL